MKNNTANQQAHLIMMECGECNGTGCSPEYVWDDCPHCTKGMREHLVREDKGNFQKKLEEAGLSPTMAEKMGASERRKAKQVDNAVKSGIIRHDLNSMKRHLSLMTNKFEDTNAATRKAMLPAIEKSLKELKELREE